MPPPSVPVLRSQTPQILFLRSHFSRGATTKDPRLGALDDRNGFSRSPRGWESAGKGSAGAVSSAASLLGWWTAAFSSCPYMVPSCVCLCPHLLLKRHHLTGRGSTYMASLYLKHQFNDPVSKYCHLLRYQRLGLQHRQLGGHNPAHVEGPPHGSLRKNRLRFLFISFPCLPPAIPSPPTFSPTVEHTNTQTS